MLNTGLSAIENSSLCPSLPLSSLVRPCVLMTCARDQRPAHKQSPLILAQKKVFIQTRKQKKLHFVVGGYAYLLPKTSVILRCPVRRFRKPMITWEKDGKRLISSVHVTIAPYGYMKIHRLKPSDTGKYTCTAGPAQEHFVIKLIGGHNKCTAPLSSRIKDEESSRKVSLNEALHGQEKHQNKIFFNGSKTEKRGLASDPSYRYDDIVSRLLEYRGWPRVSIEPWEAQDSTERNISSEEDQGQDYNLPFTMVANQDRLDDILKNLSQQPEELKDVYSKQLISQLAHEIFKSHLEHQETFFKTQGRQVSSASVEFPFTKHFSEFNRLLRTSSSEAHLSTSLELINGSRGPHKKPAILKKISAAQQLSASEVVTHLGHTVVLASGTLSVLLHCESVGNPRPIITWAKNGEAVQYNKRILLQPDDSLQILEPVEADVGFYTCNATNVLGSDSVSIAITLAGKPLIKTSRTSLTNQNLPTISVDIGSTVKTIPGINVTINCQIAGVPEAELTWFRNKTKLVTDLHIHDGSLLIQNVSISDQGLYSCRAANIRGEVTESTQLLVLDPPQLPHQFEDMAATLALVGPGIPSVITSPSGTKKILSQGNSLLIGCPVNGHPTPNITWFFDGHPFHLPYQVLASGQILQILNVSNDYQGEISCRAQNEAGLLIQKTSLVIQDYRWSVDRMSPCSASCGNKGLQYHQLTCLLDGTQVNLSRCVEKSKPNLQPVACNRRDCPSRWMVTSWSQCTQSCGGGIQSRRVTCQKLTAAGISVPVSSDICVQFAKRPVDTQSCNRQLCVEWATSAWGQCSGPCIGSRLALQHRQVFCQTRDGVSVPSDQCSSLPRPLSTQNCWTDACGVHWRVSLWTLCTATCGNYGFQSRRVECVRVHTNQPVQDHLCAWRPRPANWQRCNITPCENIECRDTTRYCEKVKQLKLCQLAQFKSRCCGTCGKA